MRKMETNDVLFGTGTGTGTGGGNNNFKTGEGFIDRSKVRILLCDNDSKSAEEVFTLLCKCSYQVTSVRSPRQVIDALNAEGRDIDIILSEVDLPMAKGLKMLKYIMRDKDLRRIPVIMMSAQDEVSLVVKCLRLGAADYLVKPLRTNELLNLWTHMWRRRRMLGLAEKNIMICDFDLVPSDPSDANTNSTIFSDDTDEKSRKSAIAEMSVSVRWGDEIDVIKAPDPVDTKLVSLSTDRPDVPGTNDQQRGQIMSGPKKSELKIGQSSAFFTYVKSSMFRSSTPAAALCVNENAPELSRIQNKLSSCGGEVDSLNINLINESPSWHLRVEKETSPTVEHGVSDTQGHGVNQAQVNPCHADDFPSSNSFPDSMSMDRSATPPLPAECSHQMNSKMEEFGRNIQQPRNDSHPGISDYSGHSAYPYYFSGVMNQVMMSSASSLYQKNTNDMQNHANIAMLPHQYNHVPHCPPHPIPGMPPFPYYPINLCLQPGQMPATMHPWPSYGNLSSNDGKVPKIDRREAALLKFRRKRKERCFDKKIRYVNRKKLAERRPRVRGQFVRKINGINVDLNGQPTSADFDDDEEDDEEDEDQGGRDSSPENDSAVFHG